MKKIILLIILALQLTAPGNALPGGEIVSLSRAALENYLAHRRVINPPSSSSRELLNRRAGVFVTLSRGSEKRGCWGTVFPQEKNLAEEIIQNTIKAATIDQRYRPISPRELPALKYSVSLIDKVERLTDRRNLNPAAFGLWVKAGTRGGVLLPGEAKTSRWAVLECRRKGGIGWFEPVEMYRFKTVRFE